MGTYDTRTVNLLGTVRIDVDNPNPQPGESAPDSLAAFSIPVQYNVQQAEFIPGSNVQYVGSGDQGAEFRGAGQYPYIQQFDSIVWTGHVHDKVAVRLDLRLINYSQDTATFVGTAQIRFEK